MKPQMNTDTYRCLFSICVHLCSSVVSFFILTIRHLQLFARLALKLLSFVPISIHLGERRLWPRFALFIEARFNMAEATAEFAIGGLERYLRLDAELTSEVSDDEEQIAHLLGQRLLIARLARHLGAQLLQLFFELG